MDGLGFPRLQHIRGDNESCQDSWTFRCVASGRKASWVINSYYYTSRENTLIPLDESHVSRLLATCVSVGSVTAGATQGVAPAVKETTY